MKKKLLVGVFAIILALSMSISLYAVKYVYFPVGEYSATGILDIDRYSPYASATTQINGIAGTVTVSIQADYTLDYMNVRHVGNGDGSPYGGVSVTVYNEGGEWVSATSYHTARYDLYPTTSANQSWNQTMG